MTEEEFIELIKEQEKNKDYKEQFKWQTRQHFAKKNGYKKWVDIDIFDKEMKDKYDKTKNEDY